MEYGYHIERVSLRLGNEKQMLRSFLARHHLRYEDDIEVAYGIFDSSDQMLGCGCAAGNLLKCFAVDDELRGQNALGDLVSCLVRERFSAGHYDLFVITRSENEPLFLGCGFSKVVKTEKLVLLENCADGPERFSEALWNPEDEGKKIGSVVMNANPFTLGHRGLAEYAADHCDVLYLFVVEENRSQFSADVRFRLVREGVADIPNIRVCPSGHYMISKETFPTYFLKENEDAAGLQAELDITLFSERIAPLFNITIRFAGQEPIDPVTAGYNEAMRTILPRYGIDFCEIPRLEYDKGVISASRVRQLLSNPDTYEEAYPLVPPSTRLYLEQKKNTQNPASPGGKEESAIC